MSDPILAPAPTFAVDRVAPVKREPAIAPAEQAQTENGRSSDEQHSAFNHDRTVSRRLSVERDEILKSFVYRAIDEDSGEVVWQWPADEMLRRARHLRALEEQRRDATHAVDETT